MACASTVAVVVPSPAMSDVFDATSFTICAPMLASLSSSSTSLATVTPSLVTVGVPQDFSMMTLRPRGPRVTFTVLARMLSPLAMLERALDEKTMSLAAIFSLQCVFWFEKSSAELLDDRQDVVLAQDQVLDAVDLDVAARVLAEQDLVAGLHLELAKRAVLLDLAVADGDDRRLHRLLLRRVGDVQPAGGAALLFDALDQDTVVEGTDLHGSAPYLRFRPSFRPSFSTFQLAITRGADCYAARDSAFFALFFFDEPSEAPAFLPLSLAFAEPSLLLEDSFASLADELLSPFSAPSLLPSGFDDEYRSTYQPPPFS